VFAVEDARVHLGHARSLLERSPLATASDETGASRERLRVNAALSRVHELARDWGEAGAAHEAMLQASGDVVDRTAELTALHRLATVGIRAGR
jgi:hypothetical protein